MREAPPTDVILEPMTLEDLDDVLVIERASFQTPWSRGAFRYELTQNRVARCSVARWRGRLVGYLCLWEIGHEIHVTNLATHPDVRRRVIGRRKGYYFDTGEDALVMEARLSGEVL